MTPKARKLERISELELALEEKKRRDSIQSFRSFVKYMWPVVEPGVEYVHGFHIDAICDHMQAVAQGEIRDLIINVPPRHSKSTIACVMFPAWVWIKRPDLRFIYASYAYTLSKRDSVACRRLIESERYRKTFEISWRLSPDQNEKMRFQNDRTGERTATSVGGAVTGLGGDFLLVDDAQNAVDVYSDTMRQGVKEWYDQAFSTRGNDPKTFARVVIMQRLHEDDLCGHLLEKGGFEHLLLPAEYEGPGPKTKIGWSDPRQTPGDLLWPKRFGPPEIEKLKVSLGELAAAGQLQQRPAAAQGNIIKREWVRFYQARPDKFDEICLSADLTFKDGVTTDFTVIQAWGRTGSNVYLLDQIRSRMDFPAQVEAIREMTRRHPQAMAKYVEEAANGAAIISTLRNEILGLIPYRPMTAKEARLAAVSPMFQAGNVHLPDPKLNPWVEVVLNELFTFPNARHDDCVDACSLALMQLGKVGSGLSRMEALCRM